MMGLVDGWDGRDLSGRLASEWALPLRQTEIGRQSDQRYLTDRQ